MRRILRKIAANKTDEFGDINLRPISSWTYRPDLETRKPNLNDVIA